MPASLFGGTSTSSNVDWYLYTPSLDAAAVVAALYSQVLLSPCLFPSEMGDGIRELLDVSPEPQLLLLALGMSLSTRLLETLERAILTFQRLAFIGTLFQFMRYRSWVWTVSSHFLSMNNEKILICL